MKRPVLLLVVFILLSSTSFAQAPSWQWGIRGGSPWTSGGGGTDESVTDIATDRNGNIYVLSYVQTGLSGTGLNVDGHYITGWDYEDILLSSFKCDGTYRWSKDIGGGSDDIPIAIKTDTLGGVYITGAISYGSVTRNFSTDTSWSTPGNQSLFLCKYDTAGNYKWLRMPQPDTLTSWGIISHPYDGIYDMDVDGGGDIYLLCDLEPGGYAGNSLVVASEGKYILKYDRFGNFMGGDQMQITTTGSPTNLKMKKDFQIGRYYVTGYYDGGILAFGGIPINRSIFIGCFSNSGTFLWQRQNKLNTADPTQRAAVDAQHNVYITSTTEPTDTFNGYVIVNGGGAGPLVVKLDSNGNNVWATNAITNAATFTFSDLILSNPNELDIAGQYPGLVKWPGYPDSLSLPFGPGGYRIFITRFNATTGAVIGLDSLISPPTTNTDATAMAADNYGNFYVGGDFEVSITVNGTVTTSIGGGSDFFVAKYGTSNCSAPVTLNAPASLAKGEGVLHIYPNPTADELTIENATIGSGVRLFNLMGQQVYSGIINEATQTITARDLVPGTYIIQLTDANGNKVGRTIVKE